MTSDPEEKMTGVGRSESVTLQAALPVNNVAVAGRQFLTDGSWVLGYPYVMGKQERTEKKEIRQNELGCSKIPMCHRLTVPIIRTTYNRIKPIKAYVAMSRTWVITT